MEWSAAEAPPDSAAVVTSSLPSSLSSGFCAKAPWVAGTATWTDKQRTITSLSGHASLVDGPHIIFPTFNTQCARDDMGAWRLPEVEGTSVDSWSESVLERSCVQACLGCSRCRYVSFSTKAKMCAWYTHCDLHDLRHWWSHFLGTVAWRTVQVRSHAPLAQARWPNAPDVQPLRLAIATLAFGTEFCPMRMWCQAARKLRWTLQGPWDVQLLIVWARDARLGGDTQLRPAEFCAEARVVLADKALRAAGRRCLKQSVKAKYHTGMPMDIMLKWQFVGMTEYDAILFVDQDTDVFPLETQPETLRARWQQMLPLFLRQRHQLQVDSRPSRGAAMRLLTCTDSSSPVNTGLMLIKPSSWLYQDGLRVLTACRVNSSHGWGYVGKPRSLVLTPRYFSATAGGSTSTRPSVDEGHFWFTSLNATGAMTNNGWRFVAAAEDQGFFWYMLFLRHDLGVYFNPDDGSAPGPIAHTVNHYFGRIAGAKAWEGKLWSSPAHMQGQASTRLGMNLHYFSRLDPVPSAEEFPCAARMRALRQTAEQHPRARTPMGAYAGARPPRFAIW